MKYAISFQFYRNTRMKIQGYDLEKLNQKICQFLIVIEHADCNQTPGRNSRLGLP